MYPVTTLSLEECPAFEDVWIERLGDIFRYRMAIEDTDRTDRRAWAGMARYWYSKASNKSPTAGIFYHHLAILHQMLFNSSSITLNLSVLRLLTLKRKNLSLLSSIRTNMACPFSTQPYSKHIRSCLQAKKRKFLVLFSKNSWTHSMLKLRESHSTSLSSTL